MAANTLARMAYGMAGALQIFGFSFVAQRVKQNANGAHTFLEIVKERCEFCRTVETP